MSQTTLDDHTAHRISVRYQIHSFHFITFNISDLFDVNKLSGGTNNRACNGTEEGSPRHASLFKAGSVTFVGTREPGIWWKRQHWTSSLRSS